MATDRIGFVAFTGKIEPAALAGAIARDAHDRLGDVVTLTADWLEEDGLQAPSPHATGACTSSLYAIGQLVERLAVLRYHLLPPQSRFRTRAMTSSATVPQRREVAQ